MKRYFVTGIDTNIGKTVVSAILTEALQADYFKPIQAGDLEKGDSKTVQALLSNSKSKIWPENFALKAAMSPHAAAELEEITIQAKDISLPESDNHLIVEGAGGLMVPINNEETYLDIMQTLGLEVILVSKNYLGSINHTLMTIRHLQQANIPIKGIIFNGDIQMSSEKVILEMTGIPYLGRVLNEDSVDAIMVSQYAEFFKKIL